MKLSIVSTLYMSSPYILEFYERASAIATGLFGNDFEIVFVNDGSPDNVLQLAIDITKSDSRVSVVDLSRNFGHHKAIMTGIDHAQGDRIFVIDCDLEEEPELLERFCKLMNQEDADLVYGVQEVRKGRWFERISGRLFYNLFNIMSHHTVPKNMIIAKLMTKKFAKALLMHNEDGAFLGGLVTITGFKQVPLVCKKHHKEFTTYTLGKKIDNSLTSIVNFSSVPLYYMFYFGIALSLIMFLLFLFIFFQKIFFGISIEGWTSTVLLITVMFGINIACVGLLGIYLAKIFEQVKSRPYVIINRVWRDGK